MTTRSDDTTSQAIANSKLRAKAFFWMLQSGLFLALILSILFVVAVCTVGGIAFVGLVVPHLVRPLIGSDLRRLVPAAGLAGGSLVLLADLLARNLRPVDIAEFFEFAVTPRATTLPVGVYLALVGGTFFLYLLRRIRE